MPSLAPPLDELYRDHFDYVFRVARRLGGPLVEAEDVVQEVFIVAGRKLATFDGTSRVTTWLFGITQNVVKNFHRRARLRALWERHDEDADAPAQLPSTPQVLDAYRIAYAILDKMSRPKREAFILSELEELSCAEIAELVGAKVETVWSRLHYARKEFAERLAALEKKGLR